MYGEVAGQFKDGLGLKYFANSNEVVAIDKIQVRERGEKQREREREREVFWGIYIIKNKI